jgi:16S rRNA (guanine966-N2)-methyltransferase
MGPALKALREGGWLAPDALIVAETAEDESAVTADGFRQLDSRIYGDTRVEFLAPA